MLASAETFSTEESMETEHGVKSSMKDKEM